MSADTADAQALGLLHWLLWCRHHPAPDGVTITVSASTIARIEQLVGHDGHDLFPEAVTT